MTARAEVEAALAAMTPGEWAIHPHDADNLHAAPRVIDGRREGFVVRAWQSHPDKHANALGIVALRNRTAAALAEADAEVARWRRRWAEERLEHHHCWHIGWSLTECEATPCLEAAAILAEPAP